MGIIGYLIGVVACMLLGLAFAGASVGPDNARRWLILVYPLTALGLILEGIGCYALGKLYEMHKRVKWLAIAAGTINIATAVLFLIMHDTYFSNSPLFNNTLFIMPWSFGLLIMSLAMWAITSWEIAKLTHHPSLGSTVIVTSLIAMAIIFSGMISGLVLSPFIPTALSSPAYLLEQMFSAILLHKIRLH